MSDTKGAVDIWVPRAISELMKTNIQEYAKAKLPEPTYNHSLRVFYFATAILKQQFPQHENKLSASTLALTCLLHDLGTSQEYLTSTRMSFEFYGAFKALKVLEDSGSSKDQAEAVCEAIIRHQDLGTEGYITFLGQIIQLATIYDNVGQHPNVKDFEQIISKETGDDVNKEFPRLKWLSCFADTIRKEEHVKPWCHTTHIPHFAEQVENNRLIKPYE
ncbi:cyanamide hydratase [Paramyrothecium foliicola]|nr:cyanamide hydratase [Paramyrothecium foliicola]